MRLSSIEKSLSKRFQNLNRVGENGRVFRCERRHGDQPISVYYFDTTESVCSSDFELDTYQQRLLAEDFYSHQGPLQWSYYLVFVIEDEHLERLTNEKRLASLEENEEFARKYVVSASRLQKFVDVAVGVAVQSNQALTDVVDAWKATLDEHGLSEIYGEEARTRVIEKLKNGTLRRDVAITKPVLSQSHTTFPALTRLTVEKYRRTPPPNDYELKAVNLLVGPNGTGKTSFLEAIELCLCGETLRNKAETGAKLRIRLEDARLESYSHEASKYRDRDRQLYGRVYRWGNSMPDSFARYNFFSSDAAFRLAYEDDAKRINSAFRELILGGEATRISNRIAEFFAELEKLRRQQAREEQQSQTLIVELTAQISSIEQSLERDESGVTLDGLLSRLPISGETAALGAPELLSRLTRDHSMLSAMLEELDWIRPISIESIRAENVRLQLLSAKIAEVERAIDEKLAEIHRSQERSSAMLRERELLSKARELLSVPNLPRVRGMETRVKKLNELRKTLLSAATLRDSLAATYDPDTVFSADVLGQLAYDSRRDLEEGRRRFEKARADLDKATALRASIRGLGAELVELLPHESSCPLCGQDHGDAGLRQRLERLAPVDDAQGAAATATRSLSELARTNEEVEVRLKRRGEYDTLLGSLDELSNAQTMGEAITALEAVIGLHQDAMTELGLLQSLLAELSEQQLKPADVLDIARKIQRLVDVDVLNSNDAQMSQLIDSFHGEHDRLIARLEAAEMELARLKAELSTLIDRVFHGLREPDYVLPLMRERQITTSRALAAIAEINSTLPIDDQIDLSELRGTLDSTIRTIQSTISFQQRLRDTSERLQSARAELEVVEGKLNQAQPVIRRVNEAFSVLEELRRNRSVNQTIGEFLTSYKAAILEIFRTVHAPAEFSDLVLGQEADDKTIALIRQDGTVARLSEVSTGQRAALALSVFLALNRSVKDRLNLILIDDPVANVDDMNSLAFLDFLRNIAMGGTQILFATADQKLAKLFEMKFRPLGREFQVLQFTRSGIVQALSSS